VRQFPMRHGKDRAEIAASLDSLKHRDERAFGIYAEVRLAARKLVADRSV